MLSYSSNFGVIILESSGLLVVEGLPNIPLILLTEEVFQPPISYLNAVANANIKYISVIFEVSLEQARRIKKQIELVIS